MAKEDVNFFEKNGYFILEDVCNFGDCENIIKFSHEHLNFSNLFNKKNRLFRKNFIVNDRYKNYQFH